LIREFRLSPPGSESGVSCDENGAFVGTVPLLKRSNSDSSDRWEPCDCGELSKQVGAEFGLPIDMSMKSGGLRAISNALNEGNVARAQIATVLLGIPDPPALSKGTGSRDAVVKFIRDLHWSGMIKADWNPDEHPRWPARAPDSQGGRFAPKDGFWQDVMLAFSEIGRAEIDESNAERTGATAIANAGARAFRDFAAYTAKPWIGADGNPVQVPIINAGSEASDAGALISHAILEPNAPLTRPGTNADWIDALVSVASAGASAAHSVLEPAAAEAPISPEPTPPAISKPFITLRAKLPADFDENELVPVGKFEFPDNLIPGTKDHGDYAHDRIGNLLQDAAGKNVTLTLNTAPNARGVDVAVPDDGVHIVGFEYAEIKPLSRTGRSRFNNQVLNVWDLEGRVQAITYDEFGNIYYGFPGL
jgi:hypothetical protein